MKHTLLFLLMLTSISTLADSFNRELFSIRCKGGFVKKEMNKYKVINLCGSPLESEVISGGNEVKSENLIYKFKKSNSAPLIIFTFKSGVLIKITETS
ncbi:DUF2845 domain-containing protein [Pseudocolwellia agarivorans]|uniref:DUF2845 domain-containing protein n=1 Tax=Pseudocolwellia agarivorans TaxID=1911682 RepID=UPI0009845A02|nr:DUF2845 domain-containing protein [Pseudocolwellia agarivorans]